LAQLLSVKPINVEKGQQRIVLRIYCRFKRQIYTVSRLPPGVGYTPHNVLINSMNSELLQVFSPVHMPGETVAR
jgi:hypothetical protein